MTEIPELKSKLKEIIKKIMILSVIEVVIFFPFFKLNSFWIFWGSLGAIIALAMLYESILKTVKNKIFEKRSFFYGYLFRYAFFGIILIVAGLFSKEAFFMTFVGAMNLKFSAFLSPK